MIYLKIFVLKNNFNVFLIVANENIKNTLMKLNNMEDAVTEDIKFGYQIKFLQKTIEKNSYIS